MRGGREERFRSEVRGLLRAMVVWSVSWFGAQPAGVKVSVAHAGSLHCATSGNAAAGIPARVLCCGKAAGFSSPQERLLPILLDPGLRPVAPSKGQTLPLFPTLPDFWSAVSLGGTLQLTSTVRFLCGDQEFILDFLCWSPSA